MSSILRPLSNTGSLFVYLSRQSDLLGSPFTFPFPGTNPEDSPYLISLHDLGVTQEVGLLRFANGTREFDSEPLPQTGRAEGVSAADQGDGTGQSQQTYRAGRVGGRRDICRRRGRTRGSLELMEDGVGSGLEACGYDGPSHGRLGRGGSGLISDGHRPTQASPARGGEAGGLE